MCAHEFQLSVFAYTIIMLCLLQLSPINLYRSNFFFKPIMFRIWICSICQFAKLIQVQTQCIAWLICQIASTTHKANFHLKLFIANFLFVSSATNLQFISSESKQVYFCVGLLQLAHMMAPPLKPLTNFQFLFYFIGFIVLETFDANT